MCILKQPKREEFRIFLPKNWAKAKTRIKSTGFLSSQSKKNCSLDRFDNGLKQSISTLQSVGVASIFSAGNNGDPVTKSGNKTSINYPACLTSAVAISSVYAEGNSVPSANDSIEVDFYALGRYEFPSGNLAGTSAATAGFAAYWVKNYSGSYDSTYNYLKSIATTSDTKKSNTVVNVLK